LKILRILPFLFVFSVVWPLECAVEGAVVLDRIAVIAGKQVIKSSDIDRDLRVTEFLNQAPLNFAPDAQRQAAERLIDQSVIRGEISTGGFTSATDAEAQAMLDRIRRDRFQNSSARLREALARYALTEDVLRGQLLWQMTVLRFIDQRFRPGVLVADEDVRKYYDEHLTDLRRQYPKAKSYEELAPEIRASLEGERINQEFESWLSATRKSERIEYKPGAFK
jgi:peptidyl-prolyl cis-trans isomerase SurA